MSRLLAASLSAALASLLFSPGLVAQYQLKTMPRGMEWVESGSSFTYPFGRQSGAIQLLYDASAVTLGPGAVTGIRFRAKDPTAGTTYQGYTKDYKVTAYTVQTAAQNMVPDLATNVGSAVGTVVFQGPLTLPTTFSGLIKPAPFDIVIPFPTIYSYDGSLGNLLLHIETDDLTAPPGSYNLSAVRLTKSSATGLTSTIDPQGCAAGGGALTLTCNEVNVIVGGALTHDLTSTAMGAFPLVFSALSLQGGETDLGLLGMPGCTAWVTNPVGQVTLENAGGGYPTLTWPIPNASVLEGLPLLSQSFGLAASGQIQDCVTSNGIGSRVGGASGPTEDMSMAFQTTSGGWYKGSSNYVWVAVAQLEGVFP